MKKGERLLAGLILFFVPTLALGAEKLRFGPVIKASAMYELPMFAAEEKGFWKEQGLEVEWVSLEGGGPFHRAMAARGLDMGITGAVSTIRAISGGVGEIIVADMGTNEDFYIFVRPDSRIKRPEDLRGAIVGITALGGVAHAYGMFLTKALKLEKEMKVVSVGGIRQQIAALKTGANDGELVSLIAFAPLKAAGEVREVIVVRDYLPRPWVDTVAVARTELTEGKPEVVGRGVRAIVKAGDSIVKNEGWAKAKMKAHLGYNDATADLVYRELRYSPDGKINDKALENVLSFLVEYRIMAKEKAPAMGKVHTKTFTQ